MLGIDVADGLLALAREKAAREGLENVEFVHRDATATGLVSEGANVVVCVFGVFFAPDMAAFVAEMWRLVTPGGRLAVTTWGPSRRKVSGHQVVPYSTPVTHTCATCG